MNKKINFQINTDLNLINKRLSKQLEQVEKSLEGINCKNFINTFSKSKNQNSSSKSKTKKSRFSKQKILKSIFKKKKKQKNLKKL